MSSQRILVFLVVAMGLFVGCDEPARPRTPPADSVTDTTDDLRERRRSGSSMTGEPARPTEDDRYSDFPSREERRRPDYQRGESNAADAAEDERDANADRPLSSQDE